MQADYSKPPFWTYVFTLSRIFLLARAVRPSSVIITAFRFPSFSAWIASEAVLRF
jgi:hypothetical protein